MNRMASSTKSDFDIDLESGGEAETTTEEEENGNYDDHNSVFGINRPKKILSRLSSGHISKDRSTKCSDRLERIKNVVINFDENAVQKAEDNFGNLNRKTMNEKRNRSTSFNKKHPKPPRPPGRPSLDAADVKFVNEIFELARLRHTNRERLRTLKKMKANRKASSSSINLIAAVITIIFVLVIIFQGILGSRA